MSGYTRLLQQLHQTESSLPLPTIQAALAHHLANVQPVATTLVATAITSKLYFAHPFTLPVLQSLQTAFRHALHLKYALVDNPTRASSSIFAQSIKSQMNEWVGNVMKGLQGGHVVMRLAVSTGLLLGSEDLRIEKKLEFDRKAKIEDEVVIALAEALDLYKYEADSARPVEWEKEFQNDHADVSTLALCLVLSAQSLPLIPREKLGALPLEEISKPLTSCIVSAFQEGKFLDDANALAEANIFFNSIAALSKLQSLVLTLLLEHRGADGLRTAASSLSDLRQVCARLEGSIEKTVTGSSSDAWQVLKTLLFCCVMITESSLSASLYIAPNTYTSISGSTPTTLAICTLQALGHLSYVVHQFGGVTSMGTPSEDGSEIGVFKEMRRTFYLALDILASSSSAGDSTQNLPENLIRDLCTSIPPSASEGPSSRLPPLDKLHLAKVSYTLACIEQLISALKADTVSATVWPVVERYLYLPETANDVNPESLRETYEAAHSVILAFLASHTNANANTKSSDSEFVQRLVPFYTRCLLENSDDKKLSTVQLCMAFSALVRAACTFEAGDVQEGPEKYTLGWFCITELVKALKEEEEKHTGGEKLHRLRMALVSCVSAAPFVLLGEVLGEVQRTITEADTRPRPSEIKGKGKASATETAGIPKQALTLKRKQELIRALYREVIEEVGDREKEFVIQWWYANLELLGRDLEQSEVGVKADKEKSGAISRHGGHESATMLARL